MDKFLSLLVFSLIVPSISSETFSGDSNNSGPLIRQVVDSNAGAIDHHLGAEHHFSLFKKRFEKSYASQEEHNLRFAIFKANLRRAKRHQELDPSAQHGVTQFSDLTPAEFRRSFLGLRSRFRLPSDANKAPILPTDNLPEDFDWRDHGAVTPVKNQVFFLGSCRFIFNLSYIHVCYYCVIC